MSLYLFHCNVQILFDLRPQDHVDIDELLNTSQHTMSRMVRRVTEVIVSRSATVIRFSTDEDALTLAEVREMLRWGPLTVGMSKYNYQLQDKTRQDKTRQDKTRQYQGLLRYRPPAP